jgi:gluconolactonase
MAHELLAEGLGWAEGPTVLPDGRVCFVETYRSQISVWDRARGVHRYAYTAGGPNSCVLGHDGVLYACQNGGTVGPWRAEEMLPPSIQRIRAEGGAAEIIATELDGLAFHGPNDLVFGPDERLYITDPGTYQPADPEPSRIFVMERDGTGRLLAELDPPTFPNGIAVEADGNVVWAESYTGMVRRLRLDDGRIEDIARLPGDKPIADGMAVAADGRLYVTTVNGGGIDVLWPDGRYDRYIKAGVIPTNVVFDGATLYMTDAGVLADSADASYGGQLWRLDSEDEGLPTSYGRIGL